MQETLRTQLGSSLISLSVKYIILLLQGIVTKTNPYRLLKASHHPYSALVSVQYVFRCVLPIHKTNHQSRLLLTLFKHDVIFSLLEALISHQALWDQDLPLHRRSNPLYRSSSRQKYSGIFMQSDRAQDLKGSFHGIKCSFIFCGKSSLNYGNVLQLSELKTLFQVHLLKLR